MKRDQVTLDATPAVRALAVGYVRVAAVSPSDPRSALDAQAATIRACAESLGIELVRVFEDVGESAHNTRRPGLLALLEAAAEGRITMIIVPDVTRLAHDAGLLHHFMDSFARRGVRLVSTTELRGV